MKYGFIFLIFSLNCASVRVTQVSKMLGNKLFAYCFGKIISEELNIPLIADPIKGFPNTYSNKARFNNKIPTDFLSDYGKPYVNLKKVLENKKIRNVDVKGFFQRYEYFAPYRDKIINNWLLMDKPIIPYKNKNAIIVHLRLNAPSICYLPFNYYSSILDTASWDELVICCDWPDHPYLSQFVKYNPKIIKHENPYSHEATMSDFRLIASFNKIVMAQSSFSWWAAFLSNASEIYMPLPKHGYMKMTESGNESLQVFDDPRYKIIPCDNTLEGPYWNWKDPKL